MFKMISQSVLQMSLINQRSCMKNTDFDLFFLSLFPKSKLFVCVFEVLILQLHKYEINEYCKTSWMKGPKQKVVHLHYVQYASAICIYR